MARDINNESISLTYTAHHLTAGILCSTVKQLEYICFTCVWQKAAPIWGFRMWSELGNPGTLKFMVWWNSSSMPV